MRSRPQSPRSLSERRPSLRGMTEIVVFHHVQGRTDGIVALADRFRAAGHTVHTPDLFDGERPESIEAGVAFADELGNAEVGRRADAAVADLPAGLVYAGFSMGGMHAQRLAQTRPGARGALLFECCIPLTGDWSFGPWPDGASVQIHGKQDDPFFAGEGDLDAARELVATVGPERAELFVYPGDQHLFGDSSLPSYDAEAAALATQRALEFLDRVG
jgi:dienelactone hydrolase